MGATYAMLPSSSIAACFVRHLSSSRDLSREGTTHDGTTYYGHDLLWHYSLWHYSLWHYSLWHYLLLLKGHYSLWHYSLWHYSLWHHSLWHYLLWHHLRRHLSREGSTIFTPCAESWPMMRCEAETAAARTAPEPSATHVRSSGRMVMI